MVPVSGPERFLRNMRWAHRIAFVQVEDRRRFQRAVEVDIMNFQETIRFFLAFFYVLFTTAVAFLLVDIGWFILDGWGWRAFFGFLARTAYCASVVLLTYQCYKVIERNLGRIDTDWF